MVTHTDPLLPIGDAVAHLEQNGMAIASKTLRRWSDSGRVPAIRTPGGQRRFRRSDLDALLAAEVAS